MKYILIILMVVLLLPLNVKAIDYQAPEVPDSGKQFMPKDTESFGEGLWAVMKEGISLIRPAIAEASSVCLSIVVSVILCSIMKSFSTSVGKIVDLVCTLLIGFLLLRPSNTLIHLGVETITEISNYGKMLFPVLTAALSANGGVTSSAALYTGAVAVNTVLTVTTSSLIVPMVYIYLSLAVASGAINENYLEKIKNLLKWIITWSLKIVLYVFTGYMGITGVIAGSADASAIKAAKLAISGMVPVVGGLLSDASETVLISAGIVKNAVGVYGFLAVMAVSIGPFIKIGVQYLLLKLTGSICECFSGKDSGKLIGDFSSAMGLILAMTGTVCLLLLISIVCFMKGAGA